MIAAPQAPAALPVAIATRGRGVLSGLATPHPLGEMLPSLYQEDSFAQRLTAALDEILAPIFSSLDNLDVYLDPWLAPEDFLEWIGSWLGLLVDETWPVAQRRAFVAHAHELFRLRGTVRGLQRQVEIFSGGTVEIIDTGGVAASTAPGAAFPGTPHFAVLVRVHVDDPATVPRERVSALVAAARPAHITHRVEIVRRGATDSVEVTSA